MIDELITSRTAKLAKEKGFDLEMVKLPTQSLLQRWLREEHKLYVFVKSKIVIDHIVWINNINIKEVGHSPLSHDIWNTYHSTYEQALEAGLYKILKAMDQ